MPTAYFSGQTTTIRSLPVSTKHLINALTLVLNRTQADVISDAVEHYYAALASAGEIDELYVKLVDGARNRGALDRFKPRPPHLANAEVPVHADERSDQGRSTKRGCRRDTPASEERDVVG